MVEKIKESNHAKHLVWQENYSAKDNIHPFKNLETKENSLHDVEFSN